MHNVCIYSLLFVFYFCGGGAPDFLFFRCVVRSHAGVCARFGCQVGARIKHSSEMFLSSCCSVRDVLWGGLWGGCGVASRWSLEWLLGWHLWRPLVRALGWPLGWLVGWPLGWPLERRWACHHLSSWCVSASRASASTGSAFVLARLGKLSASIGY